MHSNKLFVLFFNPKLYRVQFGKQGLLNCLAKFFHSEHTHQMYNDFSNQTHYPILQSTKISKDFCNLHEVFSAVHQLRFLKNPHFSLWIHVIVIHFLLSHRISQLNLLSYLYIPSTIKTQMNLLHLLFLGQLGCRGI